MLELISEAVQALECGSPLSAEVSAWMLSGLKALLAEEGSSLDSHLAITPKQGGKSSTIWELKRTQRRNQLIGAAARFVPGNIATKSGVIDAAIANYKPTIGPDYSVVAELIAEFPSIPKGRQLARIISASIKSK